MAYIGSDAKALQKVIGKKIVKIEYPRRKDEYTGNWIHEPRIILENGYVLTFTAEEGSTEYGTSVNVHQHL